MLSSATGGRAGTGAVIGGAVGAVAGNLWSKRMEDKRAAMQRATQGTGIDVMRTPDNQLKVNVPSDFSFDIGARRSSRRCARCSTSSRKGLDPNDARDGGRPHRQHRHDAINNRAVGRPRAERARLPAQRGLDTSRVATNGRGSHEPVATTTREAGRAQNRRVEIFLREPRGLTGVRHRAGVEQRPRLRRIRRAP